MLLRTLCPQEVFLSLLLLALFRMIPSDGNIQPPPPNLQVDLTQVGLGLALGPHGLPPNNDLKSGQIPSKVHIKSLSASAETPNPHRATNNKLRDPNIRVGVSESKTNGSLSQEHSQDENEEYYNASLPKLNSAALLRGFYVFAGLGAVVVMYILVRTIRLRRKKTTVRKYGILASHEDVEMAPLGGEDDEEEETTLFDMTSHSNT